MNRRIIAYKKQRAINCPIMEGIVDTVLENSLTQLRKIPLFAQIQSRSKRELVDFILTVIGVAFEEVSKRAPELQQEISEWNEGRRCGLGVLPKGPHITLEKRGKRIYFLGKEAMNPDVSFLFKNLDAAVLVLTAQMSAHQAMAECRILLDGQISYGMEMNRALAIVEIYLFPEFVLKQILKHVPPMNVSQLIAKGRIYAALGPALAMRGLKSVIQKAPNLMTPPATSDNP